MKKNVREKNRINISVTSKVTEKVTENIACPNMTATIKWNCK